MIDWSIMTLVMYLGTSRSCRCCSCT